jgi:N-acetylglucosaminyldiphosphoundecaprenol N-acetyl-beta-D-mannosaminyltransferase
MSDWKFPAADFLGTRLSLVDQAAVLVAVDQAVASRRPLSQAFLNAGKVVSAARDPSFRALLRRFDLLTADGMSVVWGARLLGLPAVERIAGVDLLQVLLGHAHQRRQRVYFLGATDAVLAAMGERLARRFPGLQVAGARNGYFPPARDAEVAAQVRASGADLLFVGMPSPRKDSPHAIPPRSTRVIRRALDSRRAIAAAARASQGVGPQWGLSQPRVERIRRSRSRKDPSNAWARA